MRKAFFQLHIAIFLAGFTGILGRLITLNEGLLVWYRMFISVIALWIIAFLSRKITRIPFKDFLQITGVGAIVAFHWLFFYGSIKYANVSIALVCFSAVGFFTALLEPFFSGRKPDKVELMLGLIVIVCIYLVFHFDPKYKTGIILGITASLLAALFTLCNKELLRKQSAFNLTLYELTGGWLILGLLLPVYLNQFPVQSFLPGWQDFFWLLILSLFCTVLSFILSINALKKVSPFTVNLSYNLEPLYGILLAFLIFREDKQVDKVFYIGWTIITLTVIWQSARYIQKSSKMYSS